MLPKVLVISHTCFSLNDSMGSTLASYFSTYDSESIAQFYIKEMIPNSPVCKNFYRITDRELIQKFKRPFTSNVGCVVKQDDCLDIKNYSATSDNLGKKNRWFNMILRNILWSFRFWKTKEFLNWVYSFKPDLIVCQPGDFAYLFKIAIFLKKMLRIPLIIHESESYFLKSTKGQNLFYKLYFAYFRTIYKTLVKNASCLVVINEKLMTNYKKYFNLPIYTILKGSSFTPIIKDTKHLTDKLSFIFAGNLSERTGRDKAIIDIGSALYKYGLHVDVFSNGSNYYLDNAICFDGVVFHRPVSQQELQEIYATSDFVFLIETMDEKLSIDLEYAFSTKIADLLASGCGIVAYGHSRIESIDYFKRSKTAIVITEKDDIETILSSALFDKKIIDDIKRNAHYQALHYHSIEKNSNLFKNIIIEIACTNK